MANPRLLKRGGYLFLEANSGKVFQLYDNARSRPLAADTAITFKQALDLKNKFEVNSSLGFEDVEIPEPPTPAPVPIPTPAPVPKPAPVPEIVTPPKVTVVVKPKKKSPAKKAAKKAAKKTTAKKATTRKKSVTRTSLRRK